MDYDREKRTIRINKELNELDKFAFEFLKIVEKYTEYVIISGYVSIILGRSRATEDIDVFIKKISKEKFCKLYKELKKKGFWCLNAEDENELWDFLESKMAIRFSKENFPIPNFEVKFPKDYLDRSSFEDKIEVVIKNKILFISSLERHIAFKEEYLGSDKDFEDAKHIEELFREKIDKSKVNKLKELIKRRKENEAKKNFYEAGQN
ncbi:hypothetical protein COU59_03755 [Candidatus Pacearchaeota archaeon CG10_big_fil_rev_8_21_14_0_10_34_12]|nr:MAG: hypothetical protein COU59_03755 [Candidatus Pacearchaeota archaeon CG10_big_fil_rev_8_21_14_0_10_34_12]